MSETKAKLLWTIGVGLDVIHLPLSFAVQIYGSLWMPFWLWVLDISLIAVLQCACLGCPVSIISYRLKSWHDPRQNPLIAWSLTYWLYAKYGRRVGVLIFLSMLAVGITIEMIVYAIYRPN